MPILPDDELERYLRQFRPLSPDRTPFEEQFPTLWWGRPLATWAAVAALVIVAFLILYPRVRPSSDRDEAQWTGAALAGAPQPLTIQSANALLTRAPSFKAAVDALAVPPLTPSFGVKQSALDVLSKDSKL